MKFESHPLGKIHHGNGFNFFFGNKNSSLEALKTEFSSFRFTRLQQIHSDLILDSSLASDIPIVGDGHYTKNKNQALLSVSADCAPILIVDPNQGVAAAVHAGWRGVAMRILPKMLTQLHELGSQYQDLKIAIGPHIQMLSFEVGCDVKEKILASISQIESHHFSDVSEQKSKVNLLAVLLSQLSEFRLDSAQIECCSDDTFLSPEFHSFRRDREKAGRQFSFVSLSSS